MAKPEYKYTLEFRPTALKVLESLPKDMRRQIGHALDLLQRDLTGRHQKIERVSSRVPIARGVFSRSL